MVIRVIPGRVLHACLCWCAAAPHSWRLRFVYVQCKTAIPPGCTWSHLYRALRFAYPQHPLPRARRAGSDTNIGLQNSPSMKPMLACNSTVCPKMPQHGAQSGGDSDRTGPPSRWALASADLIRSHNNAVASGRGANSPSRAEEDPRKSGCGPMTPKGYRGPDCPQTLCCHKPLM